MRHDIHCVRTMMCATFFTRIIYSNIYLRTCMYALSRVFSYTGVAHMHAGHVHSMQCNAPSCLHHSHACMRLFPDMEPQISDWLISPNQQHATPPSLHSCCLALRDPVIILLSLKHCPGTIFDMTDMGIQPFNYAAFA